MAIDNQIQRYEVDFKKTAGVLSLTTTHIAWVPNQATMDRQNQALSRITNMFASKAGSERISLKITFKDDIPAGGLTFTFTNSTSKSIDRQTVQDTLIPFVSANRAGPSTPQPTTPAAIATPTSAPGPSSVVKGKRKAENDSAEGTPGPSSEGGGGMKKARPAHWKLREKVLRKQPTLELLHRELVMGKQITEEEFWDGREGLLEAEALARAQRPGRPSRLLDDRFNLDPSKTKTVSASGTGVGIKQKAASTERSFVEISKELTHEIFEEFPVVQDAYARYVPGISEAQFWSRYFSSQLWERHRASVRQSTSEEIAKPKDDIFDQYLEEPDWDLQPRKAQPDDVERFLDLAATEEDHGESITVRDHTMQAGRERSALPLIRRFNDHSNKLLRHGNEPRVGSGLANSYVPSDDIYDEIDYDELRGPAAVDTISLDVQEVDDAAGANGEDRRVRGIIPNKSNEELLDILSDVTARIHDWTPDLRSVSIPQPIGGWAQTRGAEGVDSVTHSDEYAKYAVQRESSSTAMSMIKNMHMASNAENNAIAPFPEIILEQMRSCHNAANEFLRQYWSAILPNPLTPTLSPAAKSAKAAKALKMAGYLRMTDGKVEAVVVTGTIAGVDPERVRAALAPMVGAVKVALKREEKRVANGGGK